MSANTFDEFVESAWAEFRDALAEKLSALSDDGTAFTVDQNIDTAEGPQRRIRFFRSSDRDLCATIHESDLRTTPTVHCDHVDMLGDAGWYRSGRTASGALVYRVRAEDTRRLADAAVYALREVWEIVHPVYVDDTPAPTETLLETAVLSLRHDQLLTLVVDALEQIRGERVEVDSDDDLPLPTAIPSWLRVLRDSPSIRFFALITDDVPDRVRAADYLARNAINWPFITLVLNDSGVHALYTQQMWVFHPKNLSAALTTWIEFLREDAPAIAGELARCEETGASEPLPDAVMAMMQLEADGPELTPADVAQICGHDSSAVLDYIRISEAQYLSWESAAEDAEATGDTEEAATCRQEEEGWRRTARQLRLALRLILLPEPHPRSTRPATRDRQKPLPRSADYSTDIGGPPAM